MTLVEERPDVADVPAPERPVRRSVMPTASWRLASRLARREVRRRPGRTLLVLLLVALPVFGMTIGSISARTNADNGEASFRREYGSADLVLADRRQVPDDVDGVPVESERDFGVDGIPALPTGAEQLTYPQVWSAVSAELADGTVVSRQLHFSGNAPADPITDGMFVIDEGVAPTSPSEAMLSPDIAEAFDVGVGDLLRLVTPPIDVTVTAIGREASWLDSSMLVVPDFDPELVRPDRRYEQTLIALPDSLTEPELDQLVADFRAADFDAQTALDRGYPEDDVDAAQLAWGWVAGVVAFIAVGIVIAAAFATSARRQLATVGQLSANGASERLIRRTLGLQGMWTAALGAMLGIALGIAAALFGQSVGLGDMLLGYRSTGVRIAPLDLIVVAVTALVAGTIAALVPARSAARIPVLSALAGRRPVATPPRWLVPTGVALFGFGLFLLAAASSTQNGGNFPAAMAVLGALGVLFGIVCSSPLIVSWIGAVGSRRGGVVRLAARSLGRSRMRSAGVLTAVATVAAIAVAGLTTAGSVRSFDESNSSADYSRVTMSFNPAVDYPFDEFGNVPLDFDPPPLEASALPADVRAEVEMVLPDATWRQVTSVTFDPLSDRAYQRSGLPTIVAPTVADADTLALLDLTDAQRQQLEAQGALSLAQYVGGVMGINTADGIVEVDFGAASDTYLGGNGWGYDALVTPELVEELGLETQVTTIVVDNPVDLTAAQRHALHQAQPYNFDNAFTDAERQDTDAASWYFYVQSPGFDVPWPLVQAAALAASLLMILLVVAIGLSLAATESRDERDVLHVVGAPPRTLRRVAAAKAWVLTTGAAVVAIPAGYAVVRVITWVNDASAPFPIVGAVSILVVIPAVAAGATLVVSAIAQRFRPIQVSTLDLD